MKTSVLGSVAALSFIGVMSAGCSPMTSQQPKMTPDLESMTSLTTLTAAEPLPPNNAPLEAWGPASTEEKPAAEAPLSTWTTPPQAEPAAATPAAAAPPAAAPAPAPAQPGVAPLDPWSYP